MPTPTDTVLSSTVTFQSFTSASTVSWSLMKYNEQFSYFFFQVANNIQLSGWLKICQRIGQATTALETYISYNDKNIHAL